MPFPAARRNRTCAAIDRIGSDGSSVAILDLREYVSIGRLKDLGAPGIDEH